MAGRGETTETDSGGRSSDEVLQDHIRLRQQGDLEEDLRRNYAEDVLVLSGRRIFHGHDGVRESAALLAEAVDPESYRFRTLVIGDRMGFAEWTARGEDVLIRDGVDSYLVEDGRIKAQTIYYTAVSSALSAATTNADGPGSGRVKRVEE